jgi:alpha-D-ribose 1-methylphosphonate 5-triphosphate synthase subunit PhnG
MFQIFDNTSSKSQSQRQAWLALLARAPMPMIDEVIGSQSLPIQWLRKPETGLMMVQGRIGGSGERFNVGEVTVTRCALRITHLSTTSGGNDNPCVGISYILGRSHKHARLAAIADALLQDPMQHDAIESTLLVPLREHLQTLQSRRQEKAQSTKVDFLTVAREASSEETSATQ